MNGPILCLCGHWERLHMAIESDQWECRGKTQYGLCQCNLLRADWLEIREREAEAKQLDYDARRKK